jgi:hypothetical protein
MAASLLTGFVILMIGDSHLSYPGTLVTTLQDLLVQQGASVTTYGACGAPAAAWANSGGSECGLAERSQFGPLKTDRSPAAAVPAVGRLAAAIHPNLIIVTLGDTLAHYTEPALPVDQVAADVASLTAKLAALNTPCIWVGPGWGTEGGPYFKTYARAQQVSQLLATHVAPCRYVDSTTLAQPGEWHTSDGMHYTVPGYQKWAFAIDAAVLRLVPHNGS